MSRPYRNLAQKSFLQTLSILVLLAVGLIRNSAASSPGSEVTPTPINLGQQIERSIAGDESHSYSINLDAGQYAYLVVDQRGVDALVSAYGPDGSKLFQVDSPNLDRGPERVSLLADTAGTYRVEIKSQTRPTGHYEIRLEELRVANQQDRSRVAAQKLSVDAKALRNKRTEQSYQQGIEKYLAALTIYRNLNDQPMEAFMLHEAGWLYGDIGQYQKAIDCYLQARALYKALTNFRGEANILSNTAWIYGELGEKEKALAMYEQVVGVYKQLGETDPVILSNLGSSYAKNGQYQRALETHLRVLELRRATQDERGLSITLSNIGDCYSHLGNKAKALEYLGESLPLTRKVGDDYYTAKVINNIGHVYLDLSEYDKALRYFNVALALRRSAGDQKGIAATLSHIAGLERDRGNLIEARNRIEEALTKVEWVRSKVASPQLRASFLASVQQYREFYIDLLMRLHEEKPSAQFDRAAFNANETGRARSLLDLLAETGTEIRHGVDSSLLDRKRTLGQLIADKAQSQMQLLSGKHTEEQAAAAFKEISALTTEYEQIEGRIRDTSPQYAALTQPVPLGLEEIQHKVLDSDTLLLEYSLGEEKSFLWAITPDSIKSFELPKRAVIETAARRVYNLVTARNMGGSKETLDQRHQRLESTDTDYPRASANLSQIILGPAAAELKNKRLLIVSDGVLQFIPFAGLPDPAATDSRPLIADHEIVMAPSASVVALLRKENANRRPAPKLLAVLADPVFSDDDPRVAAARLGKTVSDEQTVAADVGRSSTESGLGSLRRLRFSRQEANEIARLAGADSKLEAVDFRANRKLAMSAELSQYRVVHFATHGLIDNQHPELSGIVLSLVDVKGRPQNGFLRLYDLYNLKLSADLVVLSACQTALGKEVRGEGLVGLTRGFMYAGAPRVIASLWQIDDRASAEFMKRFYQGMFGQKLRPAAALRAAQVSMAKDPRWHQSHYWAAFTLQGEWK